eukprot:2165482-Prymnesium_polylepis.1
MRCTVGRACFAIATVLFLLYNLQAFPALVTTASHQRVLVLPSQSQQRRLQRRTAAQVRAAIAEVPTTAVAPLVAKATLPDAALAVAA